MKPRAMNLDAETLAMTQHDEVARPQLARTLRIGNVELATNLLLAPIAGAMTGEGGYPESRANLFG